jgi:hypothetical protein
MPAAGYIGDASVVVAPKLTPAKPVNTYANPVTSKTTAHRKGERVNSAGEVEGAGTGQRLDATRHRLLV